MSNEQSSTESVTTSTNTLTRTPRESTPPPVQSALTDDITPTSTKSETDKSYTDSSTPQPTPTELVSLGRPPYLVEILDCRPAYETFDVEEQIGEIDEYIRDGIADDRNAYEASVRALLAQIKDTSDIYIKIAQLRDLVRLQQRIRGVIREREEFESKDPEVMTAEELKRLLSRR